MLGSRIHEKYTRYFLSLSLICICSGNLDNLSNYNYIVQVLEELKRKLQKNEEGIEIPTRYDDARLCRFLRARDFDLERTLSMVLDDVISFFSIIILITNQHITSIYHP